MWRRPHIVAAPRWLYRHADRDRLISPDTAAPDASPKRSFRASSDCRSSTSTPSRQSSPPPSPRSRRATTWTPANRSCCSATPAPARATCSSHSAWPPASKAAGIPKERSNAHNATSLDRQKKPRHRRGRRMEPGRRSHPRGLSHRPAGLESTQSPLREIGKSTHSRDPSLVARLRPVAVGSPYAVDVPAESVALTPHLGRANNKKDQ